MDHNHKTIFYKGVLVNKMKRTNKWLPALLVLVLALAVGLAGCGGNQNAQPSDQGQNNTGDQGQTAKPADVQELHLMLSDEPPALDAQITTDQLSILLLGAVQEGLVRVNQDGIQPGIAEKWDVSQDGLKYTFHLNKNAKWSNGDPVTAQDFSDAWERAANAENASQYASMITDYIKGAKEYYDYTNYLVLKKQYETDKATYEKNNKQDDGTVPTPDVVAFGKPVKDPQPVTWDQVGVKVVDPNTLEVELTQAVPYWLELTSFPTYLPINKKFYEANKDKYATEPQYLLYNGPFVLQEWLHDQKVTLTKNPTYWDANTVKLEKITFDIVKDSNTELNLYEAGDVDRTGLTREQVPQYKDDPNFKTFPEMAHFYFEFNTKVKPFDNAKVRKAISLAIDRKAYVDTILNNGSEPAYGLVPNGFLAYSGATKTFRELSEAKYGGPLFKDDPAQAKQLLAEGLQESGIDPKSFKFELLGDDTDTARKGNEFLKAMWEQNLGIKVDLVQVPFKERLKRSREGNFQVVMSGWGPDYNDPNTWLFLFETNSPYNDGKYSNKTYDELVAKARAAKTVDERVDYFIQAEKVLIQDDMGIAPVYYRNLASLQRPYVKGLFEKTFGAQFEYKWAYIEGKNQ